MVEGLATDRRGFFRIASFMGAGVGLLGTATARAVMVESASRPVWAFHPDYLYLDTSGRQNPTGHRPARGVPRIWPSWTPINSRGCTTPSEAWNYGEGGWAFLAPAPFF